MPNTSFLDEQTIVHALEFTMAKGGFVGSAAQKKRAAALLQQLKGNKSVAGRHQQVLGLLKKGASIEQLVKATGSSRRTVFRYLNHLEESDVGIELTDGVYKLK